jgi:hypothetical protein
VSHWGYGLLVAYVVLGVTSLRWRKTVHLAWLLTAFGIAYAVHSYHAI